MLVPGHGNSLQIWRLVLMPSQDLPPFKAWVTIIRVWSCVPPPQLFEHCVQLPYSLHTQSIGTILSNIIYGWLFCANVWLRKIMLLKCINVIILVLPGQASSLQALVSSGGPTHGTPPKASGLKITRDRVWSPPPHVKEQVLQSPHSSHSQSTKTIQKWSANTPYKWHVLITASLNIL